MKELAMDELPINKFMMNELAMNIEQISNENQSLKEQI